jgi:hypothetical protein
MSITVKQSRFAQPINDRHGHFIELQYTLPAERPRCISVAKAEAERSGYAPEGEQRWGFPTNWGTHWTVCVWYFDKMGARG